MPVLARLSFRVPPGRRAEFEAAYRKQLVPILKHHGLREAPFRGRATPEDVFARLFELRTPSQVEEKEEALQDDPAWTAALRRLGAAFGDPAGSTRHELGLYSAPAGPGRVAPAGEGTGHWRTYDVTDGLAGGEVWSMLCDREGNLWFGTHGGVSRYDGSAFANFTTRDGLINDLVYSILQDREGNLWFGTDGGVSRYDGYTFTNFTTRDGLAGNVVTSILQDREGHIWFGTFDGVSRYDGQKFTTLTTGDGLGNNRVYAILQDREGAFWFGTEDGGVSRWRSGGSSGAGTWTTFTVRDGLADDRVLQILQDREGALWFGTRYGGVSRWRSGGSSGAGTWTTFTAGDGLADDRVRSILQDREGHIWFGTFGGVSRFDPSADPEDGGRAWVTFTAQDGLMGNVVRSILQDREGHIWFGTDGGVSRYGGNEVVNFTTRDGLANNYIYSSFKDREGVFWFGTEGGGVSRYDGKTFTTFTTRDGLTSNRIFSIAQDREGSLWFGTYGGGAVRYDGKTFSAFTTQDGLAHNGVYAILQDREGILWFGTFGGVSRYDGATFTGFTARDGPVNRGAISIFQDREGILWFGTADNGVCRYDREGRRSSGSSGMGSFVNFTTRDGLASNRVLSIFQDREGILWFGTSGGVSRYDGRTFASFTAQDGLGHNVVSSIFQGSEGNLWFGTSGGGVSQYDGQVFQTLTRLDGLAGNLVFSILQGQERDLWFGTTSGGVTRYRPSTSFPPSVVIDAVVADRHYERVAELSVPSSLKLTAFEFHGKSIKTRPGGMVYRYRLKGYDRGWRTTHARRVEYHNLPRRTYTFEVEAVDRDLVYSEKPAAVTLRVHLPYERIGWFSALGIALGLVAWQTARVVRRDLRLQKSNEDLRREMAERRRAEEERARLDTQLQQLRYLYRLRSSLGAARSPEEVIHRIGEALMEVLSPVTGVGVVIQHDGREWRFGETDNCGLRVADCGIENLKSIEPEIRNPKSEIGGVRYERPLVWGERARGRLVLFCGVKLSEAQERALLDETAGQIGRSLEARELEAQLLQSARLVSLGQMAAGVAHEINQPLGAISATAEDYYLRIKEGLAVSQTDWQEMLKRVLGMVDRMAGTVEHLRVFSRDTSQEQGVRLSVNDAIRASLSMVGTQLQNHGIALSLDLTEDLPPVTGHPHQLEQVFLNLLSNARDALDEKAGYRDPGTVDRKNQTPSQVGGDGTNHEPRTTDHESRGWTKGIWVRTRREGDEVVAKVEDNGVGIDQAHQARLFEPFFTTKPADRGTGLGLSISYAIVKNHGGQIACESRKGEGTTFQVRLPATGEA